MLDLSKEMLPILWLLNRFLAGTIKKGSHCVREGGPEEPVFERLTGSSGSPSRTQCEPFFNVPGFSSQGCLFFTL